MSCVWITINEVLMCGIQGCFNLKIADTVHQALARYEEALVYFAVRTYNTPIFQNILTEFY